MRVLIDGYNLLGVVGRLPTRKPPWPNELEAARRHLLDLLASHYGDAAGSVIVVFDGSGSMAGNIEGTRASKVILARDAVRDVDDAGVGDDPRDHAVHDADELVTEPVVGDEADRARHRSMAWIRPSGV